MERFSHNARQAMIAANQAAQTLNHEFMDTKHILKGVLLQTTGKAVSAIRHLGIDPNKVLANIELLLTPLSEMCVIGRLPLTPQGKAVMRLAQDEARNLRNNYIGTEHLLLALICEEEGCAARVLKEVGITRGVVSAYLETIETTTEENRIIVKAHNGQYVVTPNGCTIQELWTRAQMVCSDATITKITIETV